MEREEIVKEIVEKRDSNNPIDIKRVEELRTLLNKLDDEASSEVNSESFDQYVGDALKNTISLEVAHNGLDKAKKIIAVVLSIIVLLIVLVSILVSKYLFIVYIGVPVALLIPLEWLVINFELTKLDVLISNAHLTRAIYTKINNIK